MFFDRALLVLQAEKRQIDEFYIGDEDAEAHSLDATHGCSNVSYETPSPCRT